MPAIAATRHEVSDRFEVLGFTVKTGRQPYFEIALATDPALFRADQKAKRTPSNFSSSRAAGPLLAERGEAVHLVPGEILRRFAGQQRLYYALATFADAARSQPEIIRLPTEGSPWINLGAYTGRSHRRVMSLRTSRRGRAGNGNGNGHGYGSARPEEMEWAGDDARPGTEAIATPPLAAAPVKEPTPTPAAQAGVGTAIAYDDGFGPMPPETARVEQEESIEGPLDEEASLAQGLSYARPLTETPEYQPAARFVEAKWFGTPSQPRTISRIVIHITDGQGKAANTASYFQDPMRWYRIDVEGGQLQVETEGAVVKRFRYQGNRKDCVNGRTKEEGGRTKGLARAKVSAHYVVGQDGEVIQMVKHAHVAYHAGRANADSIGIEHNARTPGAFGKNDAGLFPSDEQYRASARLVCWLAREFSVPKDRDHILGHAEADPGTSHSACPNAVWDWAKFMQLVTDGSCDPAPATVASAYAASPARPPARSLILRNWPPRSRQFSGGTVAVHWNDVQLVPQLTGMSCWAASAAMVVGWRDQMSINPDEIARGAGQWAAYKKGLNPNHRDELAAAWGLQTEPPQNYTIEGFAQLLQNSGPLWIGVAVPSGHAVVVTGLEGDGTPDGTFVRYHDPWPPGQGAASQTKSYRQFMTEYENRLTTDDSGNVNVQILHAGGTGGRQPASVAQAFSSTPRGSPRTARARPFSGQSFAAHWNDVQLVPQLTDMSCWAASAAMVVGWRDRLSINPSDIAAGAGEWEAYKDGLSPHNVDELARAWGLQTEGPQSYSIDGFRGVLESNGPLWIGVAVPSGHAVVVTGLYGDGTADGTFVRYHDPWPPNQGAANQVKTYRRFMAEYERMASTDPAGNVNVLILHAGGTSGRQAVSSAQAYVRPLAFSAFDGSAVERMRQEFVANVTAGSPRSCIIITNAGLRQLFGPALKNPDGTDKRLGTSIQDTMAALQGYGLAQAPTVFEFNDAGGQLTKGVARPETLRQSVEAWLLSEAERNQTSGWYLFGLSIMDGYHSVVLALAFSGTGNPATKVYWADQIYSGWDDVSSALDARLTERTQAWWDPLPANRKARTRVTLWPLAPGQALLASPAAYAPRPAPVRVRPFTTEGEDGIEGMEEESAFVSRPLQSSECTDTFCPATPAAAASSAHFSLEEFRCRDGTEVPERFRGNVQQVMDNLEVLRGELGQPIAITSGYRTCSYNSTLEGAASRSRHLCGQAADIRVTDHTPAQVHAAIERLIAAGRMRQGGLGLYNTFVHYDVRGPAARWDRRTAASKGLSARGLDHVPGHVVPDYSQVSGFSQAAALFFDWLVRGLRFSLGVPNTRFFPHSAICKIRSVDGSGRVLGQGSGFYIGPNKVLTAGHVLWNTGLIPNGWRAEGMEIVPGLNGAEEPFGGASVMGSAATFHPSYNPGAYNPSFDLAVIHSAPDAPNGEYFEMEELRMSPATGIITCGYAAVGVDPARQHMDVDAIRELHNGTFSYAAQVRQGSSGGPVFYALDAQTVRVVGLNVTTLNAQENRGLRLTDPLIAWINSV